MDGDRRQFLSQLSLLPLGLAAPWIDAGERSPPGLALAGGGPPDPRGTSGPGLVDVREFGARGDGESDDTEAFRAARQAAVERNAALVAPAGTYPLSESVSLDGTYLWGHGIGRTVVDVTGEGTAAFHLTRDASPGCGLASLTVRERGSNNSGLLLRTVRHARITDVQVEGFADPETGGFHFRNWDGSWTESNLLVGCRAADCRHAFRFDQAPGDPGTESFGYNKLLGFTVSRMRPDSTGILVESGQPPPTLYGGQFTGNMYLDDSSDCRGILVRGTFNENVLQISGETIGSQGVPRALDVGRGASFQHNAGHMLFQRGVEYRHHPESRSRGNHLGTYDGRRYRLTRPFVGFRAHAAGRGQDLPSDSVNEIRLDVVEADDVGLRGSGATVPQGVAGTYLLAAQVTLEMKAASRNLELRFVLDGGERRQVLDDARRVSRGRIVLGGHGVVRLDPRNQDIALEVSTDSAAAVLTGSDHSWLELTYVSGGGS